VTDRIRFTFVSDEFNGVTTDNLGNVRPLIPRTFPNLSAAEEENGQSRIYLGIHWEFDKTEGILQGRRIADFVLANAFQRLTNARRRSVVGGDSVDAARHRGLVPRGPGIPFERREILGPVRPPRTRVDETAALQFVGKRSRLILFGAQCSVVNRASSSGDGQTSGAG